MKRSKFEEKTTRPMFPRLHVNDTEKGGPRAPPRNKMALYEQLTIPSNRYNPGNGGLNSNSGASQGTSHERVMYFPSYQSPVTRPIPSHSADRPQRHPSDAANFRSPASQSEQKRNREDEDDFAVPIFSHPGKEQYSVARQNANNEERCRTFSSSCTLRLPNSCNKETDQANSENLNLRQHRKGQDKEQTTALVSSFEPAAKYSADISARETSDGAVQMQEDAQMGDQVDMNRVSRLRSTSAGNRYSASCGPIKEAEGRIYSRLRPTSPSGSSNRKEFDCEDEGNQRSDSLSRENIDRGNNVLRTSNVATVSNDVSADDVVDAIGLKHFWKARRVIVNQQRVFAVQVFELHRLVKVQQLIAETPDVLIDASAFLGKTSIRTAPLKKIPSEYTAKALVDFNKPPQEDSQQENHSIEMEDAAENAVTTAPAASPPGPTQPLSHLPFPVNPTVGSHPPSAAPEPIPVPPMAANFPQVGGHQWLVPVMSPSEGLVYKPYPGPGFPSPVCGGCGPHGTPPLPGPFMNPNFGVPPSHYYHQHPGAPFNAQGYFPPYGMPAMNSALSGSAVDQINQRSGSNPNGETGQKVIRRPNFSVQQQGSCNIPSQRHSELIGSTGSSPSERVAQDIVRPIPSKCPTHSTKEKDALTLFSTAPISGSLGNAPRPRETSQPATLVKVVPHNARTATESAARIFRSIQEERRQQQPN